MAKQFKPETLCVQAGWTPKKGEPRVLPIYQSTTFKYDTSEQMARLFDLEDSGYFYTRLQNPTNDAVAAKIAALEGGVAAMLTSSGQAANFYAIFNICQAGDHFVCSSTIYGGTFNLFGVTLKKLGIDVTFVNPDASEKEISAAFRPNTKALFGETISNPTLEVLDIEKFARIAHSHGDNGGHRRRDAVDMYADGGVHGEDGRNDAHALEDVAARRVHPDMNHIEVAPVERRELLGEIVAVHPRADCAIKPHYGFPRCFVYGIYVRFFHRRQKAAA